MDFSDLANRPTHDHHISTWADRAENDYEAFRIECLENVAIRLARLMPELGLESTALEIELHFLQHLTSEKAQ